MATQGRLRGLLRATQLITQDLSLPVVLRRIAGAARDLVGARYAALGVIAADGGLAEFVHVGMADGEVERIGHLPQGKGLLGALIDDPRPIRLDRIADDPRSAGFPAGHPPMDTFLGVPIRVRGEVFGNLYLAESTRGGFSADDEQLATALAATAGMAIDNARLFEAARARQEWLRATAAVTQRLLSPDVDALQPLQLIARNSREVAGADLATVALPDGDRLRVEIADGDGAETLRGTLVAAEGSLAGRVLDTGEPLRVAGPQELPGLDALTVHDLDVGPVVVVPLRGSRRTHGVLTLARMSGRVEFSAEDSDMAAGFASQASVAVELAEARAEQQRAAVFDDRDRIAADLHDHVIQRLFASGLSLQSIAAALGPGRHNERITGTIGDLDATIRQIRTTIFQLQRSGDAASDGVRGRLLGVVAEVAPALGRDPEVRFGGLLDTLPDEVVEDLLAVLREALSNVARHARARSSEVEVTAEAGRLCLEVRDDGVGVGDTGRCSGLANMRRRAERHGGTLTVTPGRPSGTRLCWTVRV
ncbi:GAF domain-containing protein [Pseudonocardia abyssalis]|uniref:GAF domain-containing protein n=3 Tax=Pseudonocardia abyssalis TaxID=2792008 RepID=A0ABS6UNI7_9PSEU|nr:GAF domain-containing protein [Pseudonocardia abyssalis]